MIKEISTSCGKIIAIDERKNKKGRYEWFIRDTKHGILKTGASATLTLARIASLNATFFIAKKEKCLQLTPIKELLNRVVKNGI